MLKKVFIITHDEYYVGVFAELEKAEEELKRLHQLYPDTIYNLREEKIIY